MAHIQEYLKKVGVDSSKLTFKKFTGTKSTKDKAADRKTIIEMFTTSAKELEKYINTTEAPLTLQVTEGTFQKGENEILKTAEWKEGAQTFEKDGRIYYVVISKIDEPRLKNFDEARGLIISDYQSFLEQDWIEQLKRKYPVVINEDEVNKIIKQ
jgi:peptidyl-prolyl cis-trans isomerase SurA